MYGCQTLNTNETEPPECSLRLATVLGQGQKQPVVRDCLFIILPLDVSAPQSHS